MITSFMRRLIQSTRWPHGCLLLAVAQFLNGAVAAEPKKPTLASCFGRAPLLDGELSPGEWSDATEFDGGRDWVPEFSPVTDDADLSLRGWVKHDNEFLYFAFDITDDVLYGLDTDRWLPGENLKAHELTREGFPWFGDEMEILLNAPNTWRGAESAEGSGSSWQMVCNLTKSRLGGIGTGGLLEGEPRSDAKAWEVYQAWIKSGAQKAVAKRKPNGKGYTIEWAIRFNPCVELAPGRFYSTDLGEVMVGLNIAIGDLDTREKGEGNFGNFHHEQWWAGAVHTRTQKNNFGTLRLMGRLAKNPSPSSNRALKTEPVFRDDFQGKLAAGWSRIREDREAWRVTDRGLEIRIEPGNMWGPANDAKNIFVRKVPDLAQREMAISVTVSNRPTHQYEQVDLVWYYDDSHMVKLGQELVDGKLSIVMGREENDRTQTIVIIPVELFRVDLRLLAKGQRIRGQFRAPGAEAWRDAGECDLPVRGVPQISLQCYQGPPDAEHWAAISEFRIETNR